MTVTEALDGVRLLGLDTSPFIFFTERNARYNSRVRPIFELIAQGSISGWTSVITLSEVLVHPLIDGHARLADEYRRLLLRTANLTSVDVSRTIAEGAAEFRARYRLRTPDALQLVTAIQVGCDAFVTNDQTFKRVTEIRVLVLDDFEP